MRQKDRLVISFVVLILAFIFLSFLPLFAATIEVGFSPGGSAQALILKNIAAAKKSIDVAAYSFTSKPVTLALLQAQARGVNIRIMADKGENTRYTAVNYLNVHGVSVRLNDNYQAMHDKFMVIDNAVVQTGSYNYSAAATNKNAENVLVLSDDEKSVQKFDAEFERLWKESAPLAVNN